MMQTGTTSMSDDDNKNSKYIFMRASPELHTKIDVLRGSTMPPKTKSAMVRELIERAYAALTPAQRARRHTG